MISINESLYPISYSVEFKCERHTAIKLLSLYNAWTTIVVLPSYFLPNNLGPVVICTFSLWGVLRYAPTISVGKKSILFNAARRNIILTLSHDTTPVLSKY